MFCPNCATLVGEEQKFCRSCGLQLGGVRRIVSGSSVEDQRDIDQGKKPMPRSFRLGTVSIMLALLTGCIIPMLAGLRSYNPELGPLIPILAGVAGLLLFGGVIIVFLSESAGTKARKSRKKALLAAEETNKLPPGSNGTPILSVSEQTTGLLETVKPGGQGAESIKHPIEPPY
jgi:hypothetical protein